MTHRKRIQFYPSKQNEDWLLRMKENGVSESSLINLALDILLPRTGNIGSSESAIKTFIENCYNNLKPNGILLIQTTTNSVNWKTWIISHLYVNKDYYFKDSQIDTWFEDTKFKVYKERIGNDIVLLCRKGVKNG